MIYEEDLTVKCIYLSILKKHIPMLSEHSPNSLTYEMINDDVSCLTNDYELRKLMLEQMDIKDLRSVVFNKKKEAKEVRVLDEAKPWIDYLSKVYTMDYSFVHNSFLEVLREPMNEVIEIMEREIKRRTYS